MAYQETTAGVTVSVEVAYVPKEQHRFGADKFVWAYTITLRNNSPEAVQLRTRHWIITDSRGQVETVDGDGVVGQTPIIAPGQAFTYTSACPLVMPSGTMGGHYMFERNDGTPLKVIIPTFSLDLPDQKRVLN